eukprot:COSAG06_NODE_5_length_38423_cov_121.612645_13_plen_41_part_00
MEQMFDFSQLAKFFKDGNNYTGEISFQGLCVLTRDDQNDS